jgi:hypothetical protein
MEARMTDRSISEVAAKGGRARAKKLSAEERANIARGAADARWGARLPQAICGSPDRPLRIASVELQAYVLSDGTRVLSQAGFLEALGRHRKANVRRQRGEEQIPPILQGKAINPFISKEILAKSQPIRFKTPNGIHASGYRADLLPDVCEVYLKARDAGVLPTNQHHVAKQAEILVRGLANIGIIALVDEATGYQDLRARDALAKILEAFVAKEIRKWVKTFPVEFYKEMCRLRAVSFPAGSFKLPSYFGHLTNNVIYSRLAPGVLAELRKKNPTTEAGHRRDKHFQWLTNDIGVPKLNQHMWNAITLMRACPDGQWDLFETMLDRALPQYSKLPLLAAMEGVE